MWLFINVIFDKLRHRMSSYIYNILSSYKNIMIIMIIFIIITNMVSTSSLTLLVFYIILDFLKIVEV